MYENNHWRAAYNLNNMNFYTSHMWYYIINGKEGQFKKTFELFSKKDCHKYI